MPYKRTAPVTEEEIEKEQVPEWPDDGPADEADMRKRRYEGHHTICQTLREIYMATGDPEIRLKARQAMAYAKKMHQRLKWYRENYRPG